MNRKTKDNFNRKGQGNSDYWQKVVSEQQEESIYGLLGTSGAASRGGSRASSPQSRRTVVLHKDSDPENPIPLN